MGSFANESEIYRHLIRQAQADEQKEIDSIRSALIVAEKSGFTDQTVSQIRAEVRESAK